MHRTGSTVSLSPAVCSLFVEPPVALPNLDAIRAGDALVHAYYEAVASTACQPAQPAAVALDFTTTPSRAESAAANRDTPLRVTAIEAAEREATSEVVCAAVARDIVDAAAKLYGSRTLNRLVEAYTAYATWDDARDVVAQSFLPVDRGDAGVVLMSGVSHAANSRSSAHVGLGSSSSSTPVFLRSALALAGMSTRIPSSTLTPHSSICPPPLCPAHASMLQPAQGTTGPIPPASVPMDAYARYVTAVEEAAAPTTPSADAAPPSSPLRVAPTRQRHSRATMRQSTEHGAGVAAMVSVTAPPVSSSPPPIAATAATAAAASPAAHRRGTRGSDRRTAQSSSTALPIVAETAAHGPTPAVAQLRSDDALTRAMRHGLPSTTADVAPGGTRAERLPGRSTTLAVSLASSLGGSGTAKKSTSKMQLKGTAGTVGGSGAVVAVEQDRLWSTDRGVKAFSRIAQPPRKDAVRCRVMDRAAGEPSEAPALHGTPPPPDAAAGKAPRTQKAGEEHGRRRGNAAPSKTKKGVSTERDAWTASFFTATDAVEEVPLHEQVQVAPAAGVTVVGGSASAPASHPSQRNRKSAAGTAAHATYGGDFVVPADRLAISTFEDKRGASRKANGAGRVLSPAKQRPQRSS